MYAILDIESTGGKYNEEGITEIAIYKYDGREVVEQFISLINPERKIQAFVVKLTGINNDMLRHAPKFYEVAKRIVEMTEDCIIVAHNAKFDYRLLRTEFNRLGYEYQRKSLCTVELSKNLIPGMPSYSLGKLIKQLGIPMTDRHRASGDAQATVRLFKLLLDKDSQKSIISERVRSKPKNNMGKALVKIMESVPSKTGVYYIHNEQGEVIYIGKSRNIKKRLNQHFTKDNAKSKQIQREVASVSFEITGNELLALLKENAEIKKNKPKFNRALRKDIFTHALYQFKDKNGYINLKLAKADNIKESITTFTSLQQGKHHLERMVENYGLCQKLTGLHKTSGPCFNYTIKECAGACIGKELPDDYNKRVRAVIERYSFKNKNMLLIGPGREPAEKSALLIEGGSFKGMAYFDLNFQVTQPEIIRNILTPMPNDRDARHIIQSYMRKKNPFKLIEF